MVLGSFGEGWEKEVDKPYKASFPCNVRTMNNRATLKVKGSRGSVNNQESVSLINRQVSANSLQLANRT